MNTSLDFEKLIALLPEDAQSEFLPPPSAEQIRLASAALAKRIPNAKLPEGIITFYKKCGGQPWGTSSEQELFPMFGLNPLERAISDYEEMCNLYEVEAKPYEKSEFPGTWYDYRLFPFGWSPGTGTLYCVLVDSGEIYDFNPDGGIHRMQFDSIDDLISKSLEFQQKEFGRS